MDLELTHPGLTPEEYAVLRAQRRRSRCLIGLILFALVFVAPAIWVANRLDWGDTGAAALSEEAAEYERKGEFAAAAIVLKSLLREKPDSTSARWRRSRPCSSEPASITSASCG